MGWRSGYNADIALIPFRFYTFIILLSILIITYYSVDQVLDPILNLNLIYLDLKLNWYLSGKDL